MDVGCLYGKADRLDVAATVSQASVRSMIHTVTFEKTTFKPRVPYTLSRPARRISPVRHRAWSAAVDYLTHDRPGTPSPLAERELVSCTPPRRLSRDRCGMRIVGDCEADKSANRLVHHRRHPPSRHREPRSISIRASRSAPATTAHKPVMERYGIPATARASFAFYNTKQDIDVLEQGIHSVLELFG